MANFYQSQLALNQSLHELAQRLYRIEATLYRGELRPAAALLDSLSSELETLQNDLIFPLNTVLAGTQLGFLSGGPLRGRIPGACVGALIGWLYGQSQAQHSLKSVQLLFDRAEELRLLLEVQSAKLDSSSTAMSAS